MRNVIFDRNAIEDLKYWIGQDRKKALKILELIEDDKDKFITFLKTISELEDVSNPGSGGGCSIM